MKINYCLPIIKQNKAEVMELIEENIDNYDYFEVWLDYIEDLDNEFISILNKRLGSRLIVLFRRNNLEEIKMTIPKRLEMINNLHDSSSLLDLDIQQKDELNYIQSNILNIETIISYHNYQKTPSAEELDQITDKIREYKPTILKISTLCKDANDTIILLNHLDNLKQKNTRRIILGMGEFGIITRVWGTLMGNEMMFAPLDKSALSATGQLTKNQLETIFDNLNI